MKKEEEYTRKVLGALSEIFNPDSENFIDPNELDCEDNAAELIHVISSIFPIVIYKQLTGNEIAIFLMNHIANKLIFQENNASKNK